MLAAFVLLVGVVIWLDIRVNRLEMRLRQLEYLVRKLWR